MFLCCLHWAQGTSSTAKGVKSTHVSPSSTPALGIGQDRTGIGAGLTSCSRIPMLSEEEMRPPIPLDSCCWSRGSGLQSCLLLSPVLVQLLPLPLPGGSEGQAHFASNETAASSCQAPSSTSPLPSPAALQSLLCTACPGRSAPAGGTGTHRDSRANSCPWKCRVSRGLPAWRGDHGHSTETPTASRAWKRSPPARHRDPQHRPGSRGHRGWAYLHAVILLVATTFASWREEEGD